MQDKAADALDGQQALRSVLKHGVPQVPIVGRLDKEQCDEDSLAEKADCDVHVQFRPLLHPRLVTLDRLFLPLDHGRLILQEARIVLIEILIEANDGASGRRSHIPLLRRLSLILLRHHVDLLVFKLGHVSERVDILGQQEALPDTKVPLSILSLLKCVRHSVVGKVDERLL